MKFEIHFSVQEWDDFFVIEADTIEDIKEIAKRETTARGLDEDRNNLWSREIK